MVQTLIENNSKTMEGKTKYIIIGIVLVVFGIIAYVIFSGNKEEEGGTNSFNGGSSSSKSSRSKNKNVTQPSSSSFSSIAQNNAQVQSDSTNPTNTQSFENLNDPNNPNNRNNSKLAQQQTYFNNSKILSPSQITPNFSQAGSSIPQTSIQQSGGPSTSGGGGGSSSGSTSYSSRITACTTIVQPLLNGNVTDTTVINNALLKVMGFSMMPTATQNLYITSIASQKYGNAASNYCKGIVSSTDAATINVAQMYNDCTSMVKNLYASKGSNASETDVINAFSSLDIMNGATTTTQKKEVLQNYLGENYSYITSTMQKLNSTNLDSQAILICSKVSSSVVSGVNGTSPYLDCVTSITNAKTNGVSDIATALPSYSKLSTADQTTITSYFKDFLSGTKTASTVCSFLVNNTPVATTQSDSNTKAPILNESQLVPEACQSLIPIIQSQYDKYVTNNDTDYIKNILNSVGKYQFFITDQFKSNIIRIAIGQNISDSTFKSFSATEQSQIAQRLYDTSYALSDIPTPTITTIYTELYPELCKCAHLDFDDIAWKNAFTSYVGLKQNAQGSTISLNDIQKQAMISSSSFYKTCSTKIVSKLSANSTTLSAIVNAVKSVNSDFNSMTDLENKVGDLSCYVSQCLSGTCPKSCTVKVDNICQDLTLQYLKSHPANDDGTSVASSVFNCPLSAKYAAYDTKICYNTTADKRVKMSDSFYTAMQTFETKAKSIRQQIIQELWGTHAKKQKSDNSSVSTSECIETSNKKWKEYLDSQTS